MEWRVVVKFGNRESEYTVTADGYYDAKIGGLSRFLEENKIPGRPWEFLSSKKGLFEVSARGGVDKRALPKVPVTVQYYLEQVVKLKKMIRKGGLDSDAKREAVRLLMKLEGVLSGQV